MVKLITYSFSGYHLKVQSLWFKRALFTYLLIRSVYWLLYYDVLFGQNSVIFSTPRFIGLVKSIPYFLYNSCDPHLGFYFIIALMILSLVQLFYKRFHFLFGLITWLLVLNLNNKVYATLTGGDTMLNQLLFFSCFISVSFREYKDLRIRDVFVFVHNLGVCCILIQVCLAYFLSGFSKVLDPEWFGGEALSIILQADYFNPHFINTARITNNVFLMGINHLVLTYQLLFPALVWIRKIKKPFLLIGVLMHVYIALFMGLLWFGLIMIICYIWFWPFKKAES